MGERKNLSTYLMMAVVFISYCPCRVLATTYYVNPGESIKDAIDGASYGDTIEVSAGGYTELITLKNGVAIIGAGASTTTIDGGATGTVVTSSFCDPNTVLDGFTITNGGWAVVKGGGMYNDSSSPTVTNCIFSNNTADYGSGMYNDEVMLNHSGPTVVNCTFSGNFARDEGGGMYNWTCNPTVINCTFSGNTADDGNGGGMLNYYGSSPIITNCIMWANMPNQISILGGGTPSVTYSDIQGGYTGTGNIDENPLFVSGSDLHLQTGSPCLNAGDNDSVPAGITTDLDGLPRIINLVVDMGAYESQDLVVICVDINAAGANNGLNWFNAFNHLQDGLAEADYGDTILVAEGTYSPDEDTADPAGTGVRTDTFGLISGVALYGGFPSGGSDFADRDPNRYETILSGDLFENDGLNFAKNSENSYHVVTGSGTDPNAILDGFTITAGNADGSGTDMGGGGMINEPDGSPTITNCTFGGNSAVYGGGMYNFDHSSPTLTNCQLKGNSAISGGGMYNGYYSIPTLTNCSFSGNTAGSDGGGMFNHLGSDATVINCTFSGNSAGSNGGGMYNYNNSSTLTNCILWGNSDGGGMDESAQIFESSSFSTINYCCVQGWTGAIGSKGNIGDDPLLKDADGNDDIIGTKDDNLELASGSPCIDAGDNRAVPADTVDLDEDGNTSERTPLDLAGNARFTDDPVTDDTGVPATGYPEIVEMGAYERYEFCGDAGHPFPVGDVNRDCKVNFLDIAIVAAHWLEDAGPE